LLVFLQTRIWSYLSACICAFKKPIFSPIHILARQDVHLKLLELSCSDGTDVCIEFLGSYGIPQHS